LEGDAARRGGDGEGNTGEGREGSKVGTK